jgi:hypothetical protein
LDTPGKKTAVAVHREVAREIQAFLQVTFAADRKKEGTDMESLEMGTRDALHRAGAVVLSRLLELNQDPTATQVSCECGQPAQYHDVRSKQIVTVLGKAELKRAYYVCPRCHKGQSPRDRELDVEGTGFSPGVRRMMATVGSESSFDRGREQLQLLAGLEVNEKAVERHAEAIGADLAAREQVEMQRALQLEFPEILGQAVPYFYIEMDGTGVPVVKAETEGRAGKMEGQPAHTREAKLGCCFTQTTSDKEGYAVRDEASTTYVGAIETAEEFGKRIYVEAWRRGWSRAQTKVVLADGAIWIWNLADQHFPGAIQIVDLYHAREHVWDVARFLYPSDANQRKRWGKRAQKMLDNGKIEVLVTEIRSSLPPTPESAAEIENQANYFERNAARMRYPQFRLQGLFVGSGVIEAGCKTVIGSRLKQSGMFWTLRGANAIIALRCCRINRRFEDYWANRSAAA